jgi:transcription elongation factor Elf1
MPETWKHPFECSQCGLGDKDLVESSRPDILRSMGKSALLKCLICGHEFLAKVPASVEP